MNTFFSGEQLLPLYPAALLFVFSIIIFLRGKERMALILLFSGSMMLGIFMSLLDPFLVLWDEQFHALVAKNMIEHPFSPMLYSNPVLDYDYRNWTANNIWLHKQPLFLWLMALSIKIFGVNAFGARFASVLLHALISLIVFRIGKLLINSRVGFYSALFFAVAYYPLELVSGRYATDHNDVAFLFYVTASIWAWIEYSRNKKMIWLILIGIFAGAAVLVKWLTGLLVFICWMIVILLHKEKRNNIQEYYLFLISITTAILLFLPWQLYGYFMFPKEYLYEMTLSAKHFFESIEGHNGTWLFHFDAVKQLYGSGTFIPVMLVASLFVFFKRIEFTHRVFFLSFIIFVYIYFTLASTKMTSYTIIVYPIISLGIGALTDLFLEYVKKNLIHFFKSAQKLIFHFLTLGILITISILLIRISKIERSHTMKKPLDNHQREKWLKEYQMIKRISSQVSEKNYVLVNCPQFMNIPAMFFTDITAAYDFLPNKLQVEQIKREGYKIAVYDNGNIPEWLKGEKILN